MLLNIKILLKNYRKEWLMIDLIKMALITIFMLCISFFFYSMIPNSIYMAKELFPIIMIIPTVLSWELEVLKLLDITPEKILEIMLVISVLLTFIIMILISLEDIMNDHLGEIKQR